MAVRYLILSDIHSNVEALLSVLEAAQGEYERVICCGDLVGYGPDPNPVTDWVRNHATAVVRGNHDKACCGITDAETFNDVARFAAYWTRDRLTPANLEYLKNLPQGPLEVDERFAILHGSPRDEDEYVTSSWEAAELLEHLPRQLSFFGHTHLQGGFLREADGAVAGIPCPPCSSDGRKVLKIQPQETYFLNPGSVGQPRDGDSRAAFAIFDTAGTLEYRRVPYPLEMTMTKMRAAGLPEYLAHRLSLGR